MMDVDEQLRQLDGLAVRLEHTSRELAAELRLPYVEAHVKEINALAHLVKAQVTYAQLAWGEKR